MQTTTTAAAAALTISAKQSEGGKPLTDQLSIGRMLFVRIHSNAIKRNGEDIANGIRPDFSLLLRLPLYQCVCLLCSTHTYCHLKIHGERVDVCVCVCVIEHGTALAYRLKHTKRPMLSERESERGSFVWWNNIASIKAICFSSNCESSAI